MSAPLWPHQQQALRDLLAAIRGGERAVLLVSPTGMGKSRVVRELILPLARDDWYAVVYSNRKLLVDQLSATLDAAGIEHGVRAAGREPDLSKPVQVSSIPTEARRSFGEFPEWKLHGEGRRCLAVIDEAHLNKEDQARLVIDGHLALGHAVLGTTATPFDLGGLYQKLVVAGSNSDGRRCGALVPCHHYGPDEPDVRKKKKPVPDHVLNEQLVAADPSGPDCSKAFPMTRELFGRVFDWYCNTNPYHHAALLWAAGVRESLWFAEEFERRGLPAAHIDGDDVWVAGKFYPSSPEARGDLLAAFEDGRVKVVCNRFVMREGVDMPWVKHGIMATVFSSLGSYLQAGGRLLRAHPGKAFCTVQDHGGNWWRHGSLNADRVWELDATAASHAAARAYSLRYKRCRYCRHELSQGPECPDCGRLNDKEPCTCPKCRRVLTGRTCLGCGFEVVKRSRAVAMSDGRLVELRGDIFRPRRVNRASDAIPRWVAWYFKARNGKRGLTFAQACALYAADNHFQWPSVDWPYMPKDPADFGRRVCDVPAGDLIGKGATADA